MELEANYSDEPDKRKNLEIAFQDLKRMYEEAEANE
jgi:hypothetical protein